MAAIVPVIALATKQNGAAPPLPASPCRGRSPLVGPEFDAFEHFGREADFDLGADRYVNGGHDFTFDERCGFWGWRIARHDRAIPWGIQAKISRCSRLDARARYASLATGPALSAMALQTRSIAGE